MNVFSDFHHEDLYYSLGLLFQKRLGWSLYRPIGMDWFYEGYWKINNLEETARQYLEVGWEPVDKTLPLNEATSSPWIVRDLHNNSYQETMTLDLFKKTNIDIVIASIPAHIEPFKKLAAEKGAKFIFQAGNVFPEVDYTTIPNLMANTLPPYPPTHTIQYHQEFDLNIYKPTSLPPKREINSFINVYHANAGFEDYMTLKSMMSDFTFHSYGAQNQDGVLNTTQDIAACIRDSYFVFQSKRMGDGYGYGLYTAFACGKPVITRISDYKGKLGEELLEDGVTCIDLDNNDYNRVQYSISTMSPAKYSYMSQQVYERFQEKVNFDQEEVKIREFLDNLV
ncbi:MAG: hypothetical protein C5B43_04155 [Verrucomicrobia bacterium]|nr:MAG: hypothetical protein C5B43_04155 [Verrucomicrobiota bacterium]